MTDADTARSLRWQREVEGDANKLASWKIEASAVTGLQFYAYLQPDEAFLIVGHTMSTIYTTTTDVAAHHGKVVLFTGDRTGTRECVPVILPPILAFAWKKCWVVDEKTKLREWYANHNNSEYGNLWDPTPQDGTREEIYVPRMIALPLCAAKLYHQFKGPVMPHELLSALEHFLASPETSLDNGDDWGLVQRWLIVAAQRDDGGGDPAKRKSPIAFRTDALLSNDALIHRWINDRLDASLGRRPDLTNSGTTVGIQGNMAVVQNMSGIIATEVGRGLGVAMQNVTKAGQVPTGGASQNDDAKPYTQDQTATLLGFHGAMNVRYLSKIWRLFKSAKTPNYDYLRRAIKGEMLKWADWQRCWIEEGVYFDNKTIDDWIALKFNPGDSTALYSSADKGISILKCRAPTSAHLEDLRRQEEIWDATKGNATYVEVIKQAKSKDVSPPPHDFGDLRSNIATFCALLFTMFGEGCDLYRSMLQVLQILSHPFCMQHKNAYTPEVVRRIVWAIIVDTRSFFDDIKLADDFVEHGAYMHFPASTLEGDYMSIKHGIKIQRHNFPMEWMTPDLHPGGAMYFHGKSGGGPYQSTPSASAVSSGPWAMSASVVKPPPVPYNWQPTGFVDERHPKIQAMMEPLLMKFRGRCSVSNILTASGKRFDSLPRLEAYPTGVCWLHSIATCPYGAQCAFAAGHIPKGTLSDAQANEVVTALQTGITALVNRTGAPSPTGKRKFRGGRGGGGGAQSGATPAAPPV
jgi:hypothetical protein